MTGDKMKIEKAKSSMKHRGVRFDDEDWNDLKEVSKKEGVYVSDVVRHASKEFVKSYKEANPS